MKNAIELIQDNDISILTMDDGKVNPFSFETIAQFESCLDRVPQDKGALLIAGRPGIFSAGFDLRVVRGGSNALLLDLVERGVNLLIRVARFPRPVVLECHGHSVALGAFMMLAADYRLGAAGDFQIGLNEVRNGLPLPNCFRVLARHRIPNAWFDRAFMQAEMYAPEAAIAPGFLDEVVPAADLRAASLAQVHRLAALPHPAYQVAKERDRNRLAIAMLEDFRADAMNAFAATLSDSGNATRSANIA